MTRCTNLSCFVHDGEQCHEGEMDHLQCPHWSAKTNDEPADTVSPPSECRRVPWSGSALGLADLANLVPRARSLMVGVVGPHDAGKTTLLTGTYLDLLRGGCLANTRFAGSRSLGAWESLAAWPRFDDAAREPSFPPHTPRGDTRVPGLLHLALRDQNDALRDVLLTDAPGEWFTRWAIREDAEDAAGARWIVQHADAFILMADCKQLAGPNRGQARNNTRQLIERMGNHVRGRPTVFVWAKSDQQIKDTIRQALRKSFKEHMPHAIEASSTTDQPSTLSAAVAAAIRPSWCTPHAQPIAEPIIRVDPFSAYRRIHVAT